jgi:hypothetical protein
MKLWLIAAMLFLGGRQTTEPIDTVLERAAKSLGLLLLEPVMPE